MEKIKFSLVGAGWRSAFYFRIAKELPNLFEIAMVVEANEESAKEVGNKWGFTVVRSIQELTKENSGSFVVLSLPQYILPQVIKELTDREFYVLTESFEMDSVELLNEFYQSLKNPHLIQVSEQYANQPMHYARLNIIKEGKIGEVMQAYISSGHGYHGVSLIRKYLGITYENCKVTGQIFKGSIINSPGRDGYPTQKEIVEEVQQFAFLDFGNVLGFYYFTDDQYFSPIRLPNTLVRGTLGEINNNEVRYMLDVKTPISYELKHVISGNNESVACLSLEGITGGNQWYYVNPHKSARLSDDELAIASVLKNMFHYVMKGHSFYSIQEGCQDQYLSMMMKEAFQQKIAIETKSQSWVK